MVLMSLNADTMLDNADTGSLLIFAAVSEERFCIFLRLHN
jgi:hypothetical protein